MCAFHGLIAIGNAQKNIAADNTAVDPDTRCNAEITSCVQTMRIMEPQMAVCQGIRIEKSQFLEAKRVAQAIR